MSYIEMNVPATLVMARSLWFSVVALLCWTCLANSTNYKTKSDEKDKTIKNVNNSNDYKIEKEKLRSILVNEIISSVEIDVYRTRTKPRNVVKYLNQPDYETNRNTLLIPNEKYEEPKYLNEWLVHLSGGEQIARQVVEELGYRYIRPVSAIKFFVFRM